MAVTGQSISLYFFYDNDGYEDLLLLMETSNTFSLELFKNSGDFSFVRVTEQLFSKFEFNSEENFFRHIDVVDLNDDGYTHIPQVNL